MKRVIITLIIISYSTVNYGQYPVYETAGHTLDSIVRRNLDGENIYKYEYEYDNVNNQLIERSYTWINNAWTEHTKYEYDNNNNQTLYALYTWDAAAKTWTLYGRNEYEVNSVNLPILFVFNYLDGNDWKYFKNKFDYENTVNPVSYIGYHQSFGTDDWIKYGRSEVHFDNNNNIELYVYQRFDWSTNNLLNTGKTIYEYDNNNKLMLEQMHIWENDVWTLFSKSHYYYSAIDIDITVSTTPSAVVNDAVNTAVNDISFDNLSNSIVFPNPASDYITIRSAASSSITVFDISGRIVFRKDNIGEDETVSVSAWRIGAYLVSVEKGNERIVHKVIKH